MAMVSNIPVASLNLDQSVSAVFTDASVDASVKTAINENLNAALKAQLVTAATNGGRAGLSDLLQAIPSVDIAADQNCSLQDFVRKEITLPSDAAEKAAIEAAISKLSTSTSVGQLLGLNLTLNANPLLTGVVQKVRMARLLATSPVLGSNAKLIDDFTSQYASFKGPIADFWSTLAQDARFKAALPEVQLTLQLGTLTLDNPELVSVLRARYPQMTSARALVSHSAAEWQQLITNQKISIPDSIPGTTPDEKISNYAAAIIDILKVAFPGAFFVQDLQHAMTSSSDAVDRTLSTFLNNAAEFDILHTNLTQFLAQHSGVAFRGIDAAQQAAVTRRLAGWQRVARVTADFPSANALLGAGFASAYHVASTPRAGFIGRFGETLGDTAKAEGIYDRAQQISARAMGLFSHVRHGFTRKLPNAIEQLDKTKNVSSGASAGLPDWQTLFGSVSFCACENCRSVYSAAAYFVDLLQFLRNSPPNKTHQTPLDVLLTRRPDLQNIKLNCENTDTPLPYVDLVNEILEGFVAFKLGKLNASVVAHDTSRHATAAELSVSPEYTNEDAYISLAEAKYPPSLPFDRWLETARTYLTFLGTSLYEVMAACQTGANDSDSAKGSPSGVALACEFLNLNDAECRILTNKDVAGQAAAPSQLYVYYGYSGTMTDQKTSWQQDVTGVKNTIGIENFLQRMAIGYDDLVALLKTRFLNPNLSILLEAPDNALCDLTQTVMVDLSTLGLIPPDTTLDRMHRFIRVWKKLGWTIPEVDKAITALGSQDIDQPLLVSLAAVKQLQTRLNLPLLQLFSFWADLDTDGRDSLYLALFQNKAVLNPPDDAFALQYSANFSAPPALSVPPALNFPSPGFPNLSYNAVSRVLTLHSPLSQKQQRDLKQLAPSAAFQAALTKLQQGSLPAQVPLASLPTADVAWLTFAAGTITFVGAMPDEQRAQLDFTADPAFQIAVDSLYDMRAIESATVAANTTISAHVNQILAALRISAQDLALITDPASQLTIANLSALSRYAFLAQGLGLSVSDLHAVIELTGIDPFQQHNPAATLAFVRAAQAIQASPFSVAQLNYLYRNAYDPNAGIAPQPADVSPLLTRLQTGLSAIARDNAVVADPKGDLLLKKLGVALGDRLAGVAIALINGTAVYSAPLATMPAIDFSTAADANIVYDAAAQSLRCTGPMTGAQQAALLALSVDPAYQAAVQNLRQQPVDFITANLKDFLDPQDAVTTLLDNPQQLTAAEKIAYVMRRLMPWLRQTLSESFIVQTLSDELGLDPKLAALLLNDVLKSQIDPSRTLINDFMALAGDGLTAAYFATGDLSGNPVLTRIDASVDFDWGFGLPDTISTRPFSVRWSGWVMPQYSESYTFWVRAGDRIQLTVNSQTLLARSQDQFPTEVSATSTVALTAGQLYPIELDYYDDTAAAVIALSWSSPSVAKTVVPETQLFSGASIQSLDPLINAYTLLRKVALLTTTFPFTTADLAYFSQHGQDFGSDPTDPLKSVAFDLNKLPLDPAAFEPALFNQWQRLNAVVALRATLPGGDAGLLGIFEAASAGTGASGSLSPSVTAAIAQATGWNADDLAYLTSTGFPLVDADFKNETGTKRIGLVQLQACTTLLARLGISAQQLFTWATFKPEVQADLETIAKDIQNTAKSKYDDATWTSIGKPLNDAIRDKSKEALIAYVVAHAAQWKMTVPEGGPIATSDQLYEFFLIDVDMSPCMLTSRIVQANAAVQLFVQRCLLGLESAVLPGAIDPSQWEWMKNFRVWQANRQILLYPENWMYPELRDDKTPFFEELESALLQNEITDENATQAYLAYLSSLNEVARLDIRGTFWQNDPVPRVVRAGNSTPPTMSCMCLGAPPPSRTGTITGGCSIAANMGCRRVDPRGRHGSV